MDWVTLWALAVNEENASGGRVVRHRPMVPLAIIPAVLHYVVKFVPGTDDDAIVDFLLVAAALGAIYQQTASISGSRGRLPGRGRCRMLDGVGCPRRDLGGTPEQVENAAEIGMEHNLGLTCDPVGGLVQIPCIERNAVGSVQAIRRPGWHLHGDGQHTVSLDKVIKTMMLLGGHEDQVQGDRARWPSCQYRGVLREDKKHQGRQGLSRTLDRGEQQQKQDHDHQADDHGVCQGKETPRAENGRCVGRPSLRPPLALALARIHR